MGQVIGGLARGPLGRWDLGGELLVWIPGAELASASEAAVLAGQNRLFVEAEAGWELLCFASAELVGEQTWRLSGLLRGLSGTSVQTAEDAARAVLGDARLGEANVSDEEIGVDLIWRANDGDLQTSRFEQRGGLPLPVGHLRAQGQTLSWTRRGRDVAASWALPEADGNGDFLVEALIGDVLLSVQALNTPYADLPMEADQARVAQRGADGRVGPWVSIWLESS